MLRFLTFSCSLFSLNCNMITPSWANNPPEAVVTTIVKETYLNPPLKSVGTFTAHKNTMLKAEASGRIESVHFKEGDSIQADQTLFSLSNKEQEARVKKAEAALALSKSILHRKIELMKKNFITFQALEEAEALVNANEADLEIAKEALNQTITRAPFGGILSERQQSEGSYVTAGDNLVRLQDIKPIRLSFHVPQKNLTKLKINDAVNVATDAYPDKTFYGKIEAIEPSLNEKSPILIVHATFENKDKALLPGLHGRISLGSTNQATPSLVIPKKALVSKKDALYVYKKVENKAVLTKVTLGTQVGDQAQIQSGLKKGDEIIIEGQTKLKDNSIVTAAPALRP